MSGSAAGRARRLLAGWSANSVQLVLGLVQQVALVPVFLHFWTGGVLAAYFMIYAVGSLVLIADGGLQFRSLDQPDFSASSRALMATAGQRGSSAALPPVLGAIPAVLMLAVTHANVRWPDG
ncbi:hypothetical protein [Bradyrhizobium sp. sBnM-33]|nr:hypothetical protein [Bradyrhizobium sp. sBnM-33]WOH48834.1 hypothetical protein RX328_32800 [Bradyrhizobium sp. sBnM-33]